MGEFAAMVAAISLLATTIFLCQLARLAVKSMRGPGGEASVKVAAGIFRAEFEAKINSASGVGDTKKSEDPSIERIEQQTDPPKVIEQAKKPEVASGGEHMT